MRKIGVLGLGILVCVAFVGCGDYIDKELKTANYYRKNTKEREKKIE
ncbi:MULTISPECIES: hypothetical protein [unclassified Campylobacter]|nr:MULTISPECIES: hypothetical protein [unclassified Campylobacter]